MRSLRAFLVSTTILAAAAALVTPTAPAFPSALHHGHEGHHGHGAVQLASGLEGTIGSTIGPDGALYVPESVTGTITRIDPRTGEATTFADGLPIRLGDLGGAMDVAFVGHTAYVLVTLVGSDVGGTSTVGVYRVTGPHETEVVADIGAFALAHPPEPAFFVPTGVQFALQPYHGDLLVTDGHHNRVLRVDLDDAVGDNVSEVVAFDDIVPTGLDLRFGRVYLAEAGPVPHLPETGTIVSFNPRHPIVRTVASGAPLLVDVEVAWPHGLYALSQGTFTAGNPEGSPADPDTGSLLRVDRDGTMTPILTGLDRPTSLELRGDTAFVVGLAGDVWRIRLEHHGHHHGDH
jgi:hypothetical protein